MELICTRCQGRYTAGPHTLRCTKCAGPLSLAEPLPFDRGTIQPNDRSLWRYRKMLPAGEGGQVVSLGEGVTPLVDGDYAGRRVFFKLEYLSPTGSFKDRGSTVLVTMLRQWGVARAADDSSGNAGASFAAYCARARIAAEVYAPAGASPAKLAQIEVFGARLIRVEGPRENATQALEAAAASGLAYASHAWSPFALEGTKTIAYEVWEQLFKGNGTRDKGQESIGLFRPNAPSFAGFPLHFVCPVGQGSLLLGAYRGFMDLVAAGLMPSLPRLVGVQSTACAPIVEAVRQGLGYAATVVKSPTVAEGISLANPVRDHEILRAIRDSGGDAIAVTDDETLQAQRELAEIGLYVEPTSAVVGAALKRIDSDGTVVAVLTGSGLKTPLAVLQRLAGELR